MPRAGGEADKLGNRYEAIWTVDTLLDLLAVEIRGNPVEIRCQFGNPVSVHHSCPGNPVSGNPVSVHHSCRRRFGKSGVSSSFLPEEMNRHRITRDTGLREKMN